MAVRLASVAALLIVLGYGASAAFIPGLHQRHRLSKFATDTCTDDFKECPFLAMNGMCSIDLIMKRCMLSCKACTPTAGPGVFAGFKHVRATAAAWKHGVHGGSPYVKSIRTVAGRGALLMPSASIARRLHLSASPYAQLGHVVSPYSKFAFGGLSRSRRGWMAKNPVAAFGRFRLATAAGGCKDIAAKCVVLAQAGKCQKVPRFMNKYCQLSCKACGSGITAYGHSLNEAIKNIKNIQNASL